MKLKKKKTNKYYYNFSVKMMCLPSQKISSGIINLLQSHPLKYGIHFFREKDKHNYKYIVLS